VCVCVCAGTFTKPHWEARASGLVSIHRGYALKDTVGDTHSVRVDAAVSKADRCVLFDMFGLESGGPGHAR